MTEFRGGLLMSYTSTSPHAVTFFPSTHTHTHAHTHTLLFCHLVTHCHKHRGKTLFGFRKQINSRVGDQLPDLELAESL